jgi:hypothetical protein
MFFIADQIIIYEKQCSSLQAKYVATPANEPRQCILTNLFNSYIIIWSAMKNNIFHCRTNNNLSKMFFIADQIII